MKTLKIIIDVIIVLLFAGILYVGIVLFKDNQKRIQLLEERINNKLEWTLP